MTVQPPSVVVRELSLSDSVEGPLCSGSVEGPLCSGSVEGSLCSGSVEGPLCSGSVVGLVSSPVISGPGIGLELLMISDSDSGKESPLSD